MIRVVGSLEVFEMAADAGGVADVVVPIDMALRALHLDVSSSQRKGRLRMVEPSRLPPCRSVAHRALLGNSCREMIGVGRTLIIFQVTRHTDCGGQIEVAIRVALIALQLRVPACEGKTDGIVIEIRRLPGSGRMAFLASLRKAQCDVIGIARLLKIWQVAANAGCGRALVLPADMACRAVEAGMHPGKGKSSELQMIEFSAQPSVDGVALLALDGKG